MIDVFSYPEIKFPEGFLWGASTAGEQIEGNNLSYHDDPETAPKFIWGGAEYQAPGLACNSYAMFREDIDLLAAMNLNMYRFSIEWSRIEPAKGEFDDEAIKHYIELVSLLQEKGIKVCLTLHHFSHPVWFYKQDHFNTLDNIGDWERFLNKVVPLFAEFVDFWIIFNELNLPFVYNLDQRLNLLHYHAAGYRIVKRYSNKPVSSAHSYSPKAPLRSCHDKLDQLVADYEDYTCNEFFFHAIRTGEITAPYRDSVYLPELKDSCDYWALNTYCRHMIDGRKSFPLADHYVGTRFEPAKAPSHMDEIFPEIMVDMLMRTLDKPCLITENGLATDRDSFRIVWISAMLQGLHQAMQMGAKVMGYSYWSLLDNWEWGSFDMKFGLVSYSDDDFSRKIKPSGHFYGQIARNNALNQDIIRKHLKSNPSALERWDY